ncbi:major facilitator superfamily domain-containing protein [Stachybotrys elegans]|uniref:Major facilitator superfamily domain-containing protein n=1 Tax=Stachybotrys elegans TaxID=80388 RepID=A0A8K0WMI3_9HYPO|nr:major facilitator superfamily domain-containing protein [Stachybotrys elegans]
MSTTQPPSERTPLLQDDCRSEEATLRDTEGTVRGPVENPVDTISVLGTLSVLILGVFIASADGSLVIATSPEIASEFHRLSDASWLVTAYSLGQCAFQPLYGKLSDIFGRKSALVFAYSVFLVGCGLCGIGRQYWQVIAGRAISGIGGAGMSGLVSVVIADMLPIRQVATWRSYVNVIATLGRSSGGPVGGWLVDTFGWRWAFLGQCPIALLSIALVVWRLPDNTQKNQSVEQGKDPGMKAKLARVDAFGAFLLPSTLISFFVVLDMAGKSYPWFYTASLATLTTVLASVFFWVEKNYAKEPIFPLGLVSRRDVLTANALVALQLGAQFIVFYTVPLYFRITTGMSAAAAGSHLILMVSGNMVGGIFSGHIISRTKRYKKLTLAGVLSGCTCYALMVIRWRGSTAWYDSMVTILGGLGMGITQSASFIHLAASLDAKEIAVASMSWYLSMSVGMLVGINLFNATYHASLHSFMQANLRGVKDGDQIIRGALSDISYIAKLPQDIKGLVIRSFVNTLTLTNGLALVLGVGSVGAAFAVREHELTG